MNTDTPESHKEFSIPDNLIEQLYELSGDADKYKGVVLALCSENGHPMVYTRFDSTLTELGLRKTLEKFLTDLNSTPNVLESDIEPDSY